MVLTIFCVGLYVRLHDFTNEDCNVSNLTYYIDEQNDIVRKKREVVIMLQDLIRRFMIDEITSCFFITEDLKKEQLLVNGIDRIIQTPDDVQFFGSVQDFKRFWESCSIDNEKGGLLIFVSSCTQYKAMSDQLTEMGFLENQDYFDADRIISMTSENPEQFIKNV